MKKEDLFHRWIEALETTPEDRHCRGAFFDGSKVCAVGLLLELAGASRDALEYEIAQQLADELHITRYEANSLVTGVIKLNDELNASFKSMARYLKFVKDQWS